MSKHNGKSEEKGKDKKPEKVKQEGKPEQASAPSKPQETFNKRIRKGT